MKLVQQVKACVEQDQPLAVLRLMRELFVSGHLLRAAGLPFAVLICRLPLWAKSVALGIGLISPDFDSRKDEL